MDPNIKCIGRILLVLYAVVAVGKALQCITCDNAKSHEECDNRGRVITCNKNEEMCAIEERKVNQGPEKLIFKHCKQPLACSNNERQNPRPAWWPTQCNSRAVNSVCRCCCSGDLCNQGANTCFNRVANVCLPPRTNPRNGKVTCSDGNKIGSSCSFNCDAGHVMSGSKTSECGQDGTWSSPTPSCGPITCPRLSAGNKRIGDCSNGNRVGSVCRFTCEAGYEMIGSQSITCRDDFDADVNGVWSSLPPTCRLITCTEPPTAPENGFRVCSDVSNIGSVCEFGCDEFYSRNGPLRTTCMNGSPRPAWDNMAPVCERVACSDQGVLPHGEITCEDSNFANSQCTFRCTADTYFISPADVTSNTCQNNTSWSKPKPCCARSCPPIIFDMVVIMDSSSSVGADNWGIMKGFVNSVIGLFEDGEDSMSFSIFRYNKFVDETSSIPLINSFKSNVEARVNAIPYDGEGTRTGQALKYARDVILSAEGNRDYAPDVVLLLTDGVSQDDVITPANALRDDGVTLYTVGIMPPSGRLDTAHLLEIAGDMDHVILADNGFDGLTPIFAQELSQHICGDPCNHVRHGHE